MARVQSLVEELRSRKLCGAAKKKKKKMAGGGGVDNLGMNVEVMEVDKITESVYSLRTGPRMGSWGSLNI